MSGFANWEHIEWVRQEHDLGCVVACCAMLSGRPYREVLEAMTQWGVSGEDGLPAGAWAEQEFLKTCEIELTCRGMRSGDDGKFRWYGVGSCPFRQWPPQEPYSDVMLLSVNWPKTHRVIWLRDGRILNPLIDGARSITDYPIINRIETVRRTT